ncbi:MAG: hypothetical protein H6815_01775 [Phycisphaeraceae bacterium]|nr:hypothetical protein [Phycisphaerales bacterium]MCB9859157.1 hypothetical protein [Phycisphaeraceae bacterium]
MTLAIAVRAEAQWYPRWKADGGYPGTENAVSDLMMWDADGPGGADPVVVVVGGFQFAGKSPTGGVAVWDGATFQPLGEGVDSQVSEVFEWNNELYIGGFFDKANGSSTSLNHIARYDGSDWVPLAGNGANYNGVDGNVYALAEYNGDLILGGSFRRARSSFSVPITAQRIVAWNGLSWKTLGEGLHGTVRDLVVGNGFLYVIGEQNLLFGAHCARWDGTSWTTMPLPNSSTYRGWSCVMHNGELYVAITEGYVTTRIFRDTPTGWVEAAPAIALESPRLDVWNGELILTGKKGWPPSPPNPPYVLSGGQWLAIGGGIVDSTLIVSAVQAFGQDLLVGGSFTHNAPHKAQHIVRWDGATWSPLACGIGDYVFDFKSVGTHLYATGGFEGGVVEWDGCTWRVLGPLGPDPYGTTLEHHKGDLYVGGIFQVTEPINVYDLVMRWNGTAWESIASKDAGSSYDQVRTMVSYNGDLILGGRFDTINKINVKCLARWDGSTWHQFGDGTLTDAKALGVYNGDLYLTGYFQTGTYVDRYDGTAWTRVGTFQSFADPGVLAEYNGDLYIGGRFSYINGMRSDHIARWDGSQWHPVNGIGDSNKHVSDLAVHNGLLFASGDFYVLGNSISPYINAYDGEQWIGISRNGPDEWIRTIASHQGHLLMAGEFDSVGELSSPGFARLELTCYADCDESGMIDMFDYICFGNAYTNNEPYADCDSNSTFNIFDYICFGSAYATGCP